MASKSASIIALKVEEFLSRALTEEELLRVEELNINYYTNAVCRYVEGLIRDGKSKDFEFVYRPIMNGLLRGAFRRRDIIYIRGRFKDVYLRMHQLTGSGMSNGELESIIFLAEDCNDREIDAAIAIARNRGIHHVKYVRAVIENNRRAASRAVAARQFKKYVPETYHESSGVDVPRVDVIRDTWKKRLAAARKKVEISEAELNASQKVKKRGS